MTLRRRLRSSTSDRLDVPAVRLSTVGRRAFLVSGANIWNDLPSRVTSAQSLEVLQTTSQDIPVHLFISEHFHLTYFLTFSVDLAIANFI